MSEEEKKFFIEEWERELAKTLRHIKIEYDSRTACIAIIAVHCHQVIERQALRARIAAAGLDANPLSLKILDVVCPVGKETTEDLMKRFMNRVKK